MSFTMNLDTLVNGLTTFEDRADMAIRMYAETSALKLQNSARNNAKWKDRTAHARQRLRGSSYKFRTGYKLELAHGVDYGMWLELANEKRFAIIEETILTVGTQEIMPGLERLLDRLSG